MLLGKPLVFGAIFKFEGQLSVFNYRNGPIYRCLYPDPPAPGDAPSCADIGVLGVLPGIVGTLGLLDFDTVDDSNLQRQVLYATADVGRPKAVVAAEKLTAQNPFIDLRVHQQLLTVANALALLAGYDLVVDCSDNFATRYLVNDACVLLGKPLVFGAIFKFEGQLSVFNYRNGPTYRCLYPDPPAPGDAPSCPASWARCKPTRC